jgi:hypothetical protein
MGRDRSFGVGESEWPDRWISVRRFSSGTMPKAGICREAGTEAGSAAHSPTFSSATNRMSVR